MADGGFCLVLHGHLPWVLHHGRWPHGEDWLYEAAAETWLPMIDVLDTLESEGVRPGWTLGLTPILLEQLGHVRFRDGLVRFLEERREHALRDEVELRDDPHLSALAARWATHHTELLARFDRIDRDIPGALRGRPGLELLSSNATHGYHPLILQERCARAQIRAGLATSERHLGHRPRAVWLPECAYRPAGSWWPPVLHGYPRDRLGVAELFGEEGVKAFVVDTHLVTGSVPVARLDAAGIAHPVTQADRAEPTMAWNSIYEPLRVVERDALTPITVVGRCPEVSEQVWSGEVGYPGDGRYLEFHKRRGLRGLRYWRVTGSGVELGAKQVYAPDEVDAALHSHAAHFVGTLQRRLAGHKHGCGRYGVIAAPFDAELFGHWWHEGPRFLLHVARRLHAQSQVDPLTLSEMLARVPADKAAAMPEGTWGAGGDHRVWLNDELRFYWELAYRAEDRFLDVLDRSTGRPACKELLEEAGRQLLLLQASDWPFVIHTRGAVDYGLRRILDHAGRFDDLCNGVEDVLSGAAEDPVVRDTLARCRLVDPVFPDLSLAWWS